ncbi:MAG: hypothetical protein LUH40_00465, partial [Clostridiales bacterium]|nr:hypothetical protein [Clostridiales bacterium]
MAQKKVSGKKTKDSEKKSLHSSVLSNDEYEDFIAKHSADLRKRSTGTIAVPKKKTGDTYEENQARCGEIDPHTTVNPALQRQILTKRTGRILPDDTGFKSMSYNNRFELQPEMPETLINENPAEQSGSSADYDIIPGQQTMADIAALNSSDGISVPIEEKAEPEDFFTNAYQSMKKSGQVSYGKSEKLRAIARTAADDAEMEPESQLTFPAFDPLFKFPENKEENEEKKERKKDKKQKGKSRNTQSSSKEQEENTGFDIDETEILTTEKEPEIPVEENTSDEDIEREEDTEKSNKSKIFDLLADSEKERDDPPPY